MSNVHDFRERLAWGEAASAEPFWKAVYRKAFPDLVGIARNDCQSRSNLGQHLGIDRWIHLSSGKTLTVDEKRRGREYPDVLLEHTSNDRTGAPGWIEKDLQIDFLAYGFVPSGRCHLFPWQLLRRAWLHHRRDWMDKARASVDGFRDVNARNAGYTTLSIAVPSAILRKAVSSASLIDVSDELRKAPHGVGPR